MEEQQYKLLDGKAVSAQMKQEMAEEVARIKAAGGKPSFGCHIGRS